MTSNSSITKHGSLVIFSDDWGRHPSSCQHLVRRLVDRYEVLWVNTIGTRSPKIDLATFRRAAGKFRQWLVPLDPGGEGHADVAAPAVRIANPPMWPWFRRPVDRWINRRMLLGALRPQIASLPRPITAVTTIPLVADLVGELDVDRWLYYCVDDLASWPGLDRQPLLDLEHELVHKVDGAIAVSEFLRDKLAAEGLPATLVSHGVDLDHWRQPLNGKPSAIASLAGEGSWVVFWGLLDERLDPTWILAVADAIPPSSAVILAGPVVAADPRLTQHPRIHFTGPLAYQDLPALARRAAVLIMPYREMPATLAMQPLKLKEYLATGLPCVVRDLPATRLWGDCVDLATSAVEFRDVVIERLSHGIPAAQRHARERLADESWQAKAEEFEAAIQSLGSQKRPLASW